MPLINFVSESIYFQSIMKINIYFKTQWNVPVVCLPHASIKQPLNSDNWKFHLPIKARHTTGSSACSISSADISPDSAGTEDAAGTEDEATGAEGAAATEDEAGAEGAAATEDESNQAAAGAVVAGGVGPFLRHCDCDLTWQATHCRTATTSNTSWVIKLRWSHFMFVSNKTFLLNAWPKYFCLWRWWHRLWGSRPCLRRRWWRSRKTGCAVEPLGKPPLP